MNDRFIYRGLWIVAWLNSFAHAMHHVGPEPWGVVNGVSGALAVWFLFSDPYKIYNKGAE